ncbi:MAG: sialate O-acetylesterase, partial [Opitutaceae bacterium]|nr:sialate O-acetylesterase [Opitutaceae bacterium]
PVWGLADPGEQVTVTLDTGKTSVSATATADKNGRWLLALPRQPAVATPCTLTVRATNQITLQNLLIGEVWLCGGQSNMEWFVRNAGNPDAEIAAAHHPLIRHIKIKRDFSQASPVPRLTTLVDNDGWTVCSPQTVANYTATGYYFAREIQRELNVPVGLVNNAWGGTRVETWIPRAAAEADPKFRFALDACEENVRKLPELQARYEKQKAKYDAARAAAKKEGRPFTQKAPKPPAAHQFLSRLYNGMVHPLLPFAARGVIWYQGEANARDHAHYRDLFHLLINSWRKAYQQDLSFYWVQLASYKAGDSAGLNYAFLREAQDQTLDLPKTGQALAIDIGEEDNIHPKNKQEVGRRLALLALKNDYGRASLNTSGPRFAKMSVNGSVARVELSNASGLHTRGDAPAGALEIAGSDKTFHPASATIDGSALLVSSPAVSKPVAVRHAFRNYPKPEVNLVNADNLPLAPFRTDDWPAD